MIDPKYAKRMSDSQSSVIREMLKLSQDKSYISFAGSDSDPRHFPFDQLEEEKQKQIANGQKFRRGISEGSENLREALAEYLRSIDLHPEINEIQITTGSQQALDLTGKLFIDEGDAIVVERPTYMGAINAFKLYYPRILEADMDEDGMKMDHLEKLLKTENRIKFIYTIPDFQNPTGRCLSAERRQRMVELAEKYNVMILEDSPYYSLRFDGKRIPPIMHYDECGCVIYLGSASKIISPSLRVGWLYSYNHIIKKYLIIKQSSDLHTNEDMQHQIADALRSDTFAGHICDITATYRKKRDLMIRLLNEHMGSEIYHTSPNGGLYLWLVLPKNWVAEDILKMSLKEKIIFIPGSNFFVSKKQHNTLRLSYATMKDNDIIQGIKKLSSIFETYKSTLK